tara:strand:+ start:508 stop:894 length:387 start_codon:yes stop_codon:yes gene_type:complete
MKRLLISLTLIISANAWADDEFPIELTCEVGAETIFFYLNETKDGSWYKLHETSPQRPDKKRYRLGEKIFIKRKYEIEPNTIRILAGTLLTGEVYIINRYSLRVVFILMNSIYSGQCYKGFKEYEKQI